MTVTAVNSLDINRFSAALAAALAAEYHKRTGNEITVKCKMVHKGAVQNEINKVN